MAECEDWEDDGNLLGAVLVCNNYGECGHKSGPSQPLVCDCCEVELKKLFPLRITDSEKKPWEPPLHYKEGQCRCDCHDEKVLHIVACCDQTYVPRAKMKPHAPRPEPVVGDFTKFTMPIVRPQPPE
jgi:hypothetical protein